MELGGTLLLHYYLADDSHAMDAAVRNKCEAEALAIFHEIARLLDVKISIECVVPKEGGLLESWNFLGKHKDELTVISSVVMPLIVVALTKAPKSDPELGRLSKEEKRLSIIEKELRIELLKRELLTNEISKEAIEFASHVLDCNQKVAFRKSNFYRFLNSYKKVSGIGLTSLNKDSVKTEEEQYVDRRDFRRFVLATDKLPAEIIEDAKIEIISPVLKEGDYQWKGIYEGGIIPFSMVDSEFRNSVLREEVSFKHGSVIECVLNIERKFNEVGDITPTGYAVTTVLKKTDGVVSVETVQGKRFLRRKKFKEDQLGLCFEGSFPSSADSLENSGLS
jgi:hypothetical protein